MKAVPALIFALTLALAVAADTGFHYPAGSNGRCDHIANDRSNAEANRLFNSQNNNAWGYAVRPSSYFYEGSVLSIEWTSQHSCGNQGKVNCEIILQYMCDPSIKDGTPTDPTGNGGGDTCTTRVDENNQNQPEVGRHEPFAFFDACNNRQRNTRLFTSNDNPSNNQGAQATRQNPGGNSNGFECQEERDYYPYFHPTPWIDIAVLTSNTSRCSYYRDQSENVQGRGWCDDPAHNNQAACEAASANWAIAPSHRDTFGRRAVSAPVCEEAPWSRDNHLGSGQGGYMNGFNWTIPNNANAAFDGESAAGSNCVLRMRYNISTNDYDSWATDSSANGNNGPIDDDPIVDYGGLPIRLAIDTDQFGRTFEDRTHTFSIVPAYQAGGGFLTTIYNLGVRGKRGNIAQVRNCVEYDFVPERLHAAVGDWVHIQLSGSNFNDDGNDGEGLAGTDRSNLVPLINNDLKANYIEAADRQRMFSSVEIAQFYSHLAQSPPDGCLPVAQIENNQNEQNVRNCALLNGAPDGYFDGGVIRINRSGVFNYIGTRNNNFSNRGQKGTWIISAFNDTIILVMATIVGAILLSLTGAGVFFAVTGGSFAVYWNQLKNKRASFGSRRSAGGQSMGSHRSGRSHGSQRSKGSFGASMI